MSSTLFAGYVLVFGLSAVACFVSLSRATQIQDPDVRVGLYGLLGTSGGWAAAHVGYLVVPTETAKVTFYLAGLVVGFAAIGAWLYFCSAYTERTYHRQRVYRYLAVGVFGVVVALKLTNPIHSLYFTAEIVSSPFSHLAVSHGVVHWLAMGLAYALAFVGLFMLFERFVVVGFDTTPLAVLVGFTALPVFADVVGLVSPRLLDMTYEPVGVAVFAVGVLFLYFERFQAVNLAGESDVPVVFLDGSAHVRDYNRRARELFPSLADSIGAPISSVSTQLAAGVTSEGYVLEQTTDTGTDYYLVSATPVSAGDANTGYLLSLTDMTEKEQYRHELERKTTLLEQFASVVSHDLRNPLNVADLRLAMARKECDSEHLDEVERSLTRMETLIEDLLTLARKGQAIDEFQDVYLPAVVNRGWQGVDTKSAELVVETDILVAGDPDRLQQLFENLFRNAIEHGGSDVTITVGTLPNGFYVEDDGPGIPEDERDDVFEFGYSTAESGTGLGLSIVSEIGTAHGWEISVTEGQHGGARFEITGVERLYTGRRND